MSAETTVETEAKIVAALAADLPQSVRIMNAAAITEEIVHGRDATVDDDDLSPQAVYDGHQEVLDAMVDTGVLQTGETFGMTVYGFTQQTLDPYFAEKESTDAS